MEARLLFLCGCVHERYGFLRCRGVHRRSTAVPRDGEVSAVRDELSIGPAIPRLPAAIQHAAGTRISPAEFAIWICAGADGNQSPSLANNCLAHFAARNSVMRAVTSCG